MSLELEKEVSSKNILNEVCRIIGSCTDNYTVLKCSGVVYPNLKENQFELHVVFPNKTALKISLEKKITESDE